MAAAQDGDPFAPPAGHVDQLQGVDVLPAGRIPCVMDQVDLEVTWLRQIPRQAPSRNGTGQRVALGRAAASQAGLVAIPPHALDHPPDRGDADAPQVVQQVRGQLQFAMAG